MNLNYAQVGDSWGKVELSDSSWRFNLNHEGTSWVDAKFLPKKKVPDKEEFTKIWELHPPERGKGMIMGKIIEFPRWQQSYGLPYTFTGIRHKALPIPNELLPYLEFANSDQPEGWKFNQILLNWYGDGSDYIGPHSDSEKQLKKGPNGETLVWSATFQEGDLPRTFRLKPKTGGKDRLDITLDHGLILVMGGLCQVTHKHQVPKVNRKPERFGKRINLTFRVFG